MIHISEIIAALQRSGYRVAELADVASATRRGMLFEVIDGDDSVVIMSLTTAADVSKTADAHPGVPASLYFPAPRPESNR